MEIKDSKITNEVKRVIEKEPSKQSRCIISVSAQYSVTDLLALIGQLPGIDTNTIENTDYFVFASLTVEQIQQLEQCNEVEKIWLNKETELMTTEALSTINAVEYCLNQAVMCNDITWAIIDDGIDSSHEALRSSKIIDRDLTGEGSSGPHGTFVAGILAGWNPDRPFRGVAPQCQLYNFKVYSKNANWVSLTIKAMEEIRKINEQAGKLVIHGANLSLGVPNETNIKEFHSGHSPICQEANRLVESGVVVCVAAGNFGAQAYMVPGKNGESNIWANFELLSITDPGNAELPITVGSTHKKFPEKFGISAFSSKGPTGDGRIKPDLVAPGEDVLSTIPNNGYITQCGTSVATPFVSGTVAQLLHACPELKGKPKEVKRILVDSCRDLHRDRTFQGAGLIDLERAVKVARDHNY